MNPGIRESRNSRNSWNPSGPSIKNVLRHSRKKSFHGKSIFFGLTKFVFEVEVDDSKNPGIQEFLESIKLNHQRRTPSLQKKIIPWKINLFWSDEVRFRSRGRCIQESGNRGIPGIPRIHQPRPSKTNFVTPEKIIPW